MGFLSCINKAAKATFCDFTFNQFKTSAFGLSKLHSDRVAPSTSSVSRWLQMKPDQSHSS